jgi:hypothetical protein
MRICRAVGRSAHFPSHWDYGLGFRVARVPFGKDVISSSPP